MFTTDPVGGQKVYDSYGQMSHESSILWDASSTSASTGRTTRSTPVPVRWFHRLLFTLSAALLVHVVVYRAYTI